MDVDFLDLLESLNPKAAKWETIGFLLGLGAGELETIRADSNGVEQCLRKVLQKWYDRSLYPTLHLGDVIAALRSPLVGDPALAQKLEAKQKGRMANQGEAIEVIRLHPLFARKVEQPFWVARSTGGIIIQLMLGPGMS